MTVGTNLDRCLAFISCQLTPPASREERRRAPAKPRPAVTISRQTGAGAMAIAEKLAAYLQARDPVPCGWTVFDRNLVEKVLEDHNLPKQLAAFMPEDRVSAIRDIMEEVLGLHPSSWTLLRDTAETILHLAELGNVILVGRASNIITARLRNVFHVRLVAPLEQRVQRVMQASQMDHRAALSYIEQEDAGRKRYLKLYFKADIDNSLAYDLVINTARLSPDAVAGLIGEAVLRWAETL